MKEIENVKEGVWEVIDPGYEERRRTEVGGDLCVMS